MPIPCKSGQGPVDKVYLAWLLLNPRMPFCAKIASPCKNPASGNTPDRRIMIVRFLMQNQVVDGTDTFIQRPFPTICCKGCFESNLCPNGLGSSSWSEFPSMLGHGIASTAAKSLIKDPQLKSRETFFPSAYCLFTLFEECGLRAAVSDHLNSETASLQTKKRGFTEFQVTGNTNNGAPYLRAS